MARYHLGLGGLWVTPYMHGHSRETKDYRTSWLVCGSANGLRVRVSGWVLGVCGGGDWGVTKVLQRTKLRPVQVKDGAWINNQCLQLSWPTRGLGHCWRIPFVSYSSRDDTGENGTLDSFLFIWQIKCQLEDDERCKGQMHIFVFSRHTLLLLVTIILVVTYASIYSSTSLIAILSVYCM